jgi:hypothetical protein
MSKPKEKQEWRKIPGTEGKYLIDNLGTGIFSVKKERLLKGNLNSMGYPRTPFIIKDGIHRQYLIHRLVWETFVGKTKRIVHHIDENPANFRLDNLQPKRFKRHIQEHLFGTKHTNGKRTDYQIYNKQGHKVILCSSQKEVAEYLGFTLFPVAQHLNGNPNFTTVSNYKYKVRAVPKE